MQNSEDYLEGLKESEEVALQKKMFDAIKTGIEIRQRQVTRRKRIWKKATLAASISLVLVSVISIWVWTGSIEVVYHTAADEILELTLPDSSSVTLNSNSTLSYRMSRLSGFDRKVRLEGEAFFSIRKDGEGNTFEVNEGGDLGVTVLGTKFNVKSSGLVEKVTLMEGSVLLGYEGKNGVSEHLMTPGECAKMDPRGKNLNSIRVENPERLSSWRDRKLKMENENLGKVLETVLEIYDLTLDDAGTLQSGTAVSGSLPLSDRPEVVLENLGILFGTSITLNGSKVTIAHIKQSETN
jgi:ferric-dicitrate binding protein FerR (iron transport regulator)